jgi:outer membrane biosynthesis protein TonB
MSVLDPEDAMRRSRLVLALVAPIAAMAVGCQAISDLTPTEPTPTPTPSSSVAPISIPVIRPEPTPTPTPAPTPTPTPGPTPTPTPTPTPGPACSLPASNPGSYRCTDDPNHLQGYVEAAITATTEAKPGLFDFNDKKCDNCYRVLDVDGYLSEFQRQLSAQGVCSYWDGEEIAAKNTNNFSEQYDILLASGHIRRGLGAYRGVCAPAIF